MKTAKILTALVLAGMMAISTAAVDFVPSREYYEPGTVVGKDPETGDDYVGKVTDGSNKVVEYLDEEDIIINFDKEDEDIKEGEENLTNNDIKDIVDNFEEEWKEATGGAPTENTGITNIFEVTVPEGTVEEGGKVEIQITVDQITKDDNIVIIRKDDDKWVVVEHTIDDNGVITVVIDDPNGNSVFAIITDTTLDPTPGQDSPQTGVEAYSVAVIACAAVLCGVAYIVIRKASKNRTAA